MSEKKSITIETINSRKDYISENHVIPLRIMISVQSGRQYLMAYVPRFKKISSFRTDHIVSVKLEGVSERFDELRGKLDDMKPHMWGVSTQGRFGQRMEHVEFTVHYEDDEQHIHQRLEREKRCGIVEKIDKNTSRFYADIYDVSEMIPWIRTFESACFKIILLIFQIWNLCLRLRIFIYLISMQMVMIIQMKFT